MLVSITRTVVPILVGVLAGAWTWLTGKVGVTLPFPEEWAQEVTTLAVGAVYYAAVRLFEEHVKPKIGWLLGWAQAPRYDDPVAPF